MIRLGGVEHNLLMWMHEITQKGCNLLKQQRLNVLEKASSIFCSTNSLLIAGAVALKGFGPFASPEEQHSAR